MEGLWSVKINESKTSQYISKAKGNIERKKKKKKKKKKCLPIFFSCNVFLMFMIQYQNFHLKGYDVFHQMSCFPVLT